MKPEFRHSRLQSLGHGFRNGAATLVRSVKLLVNDPEVKQKFLWGSLRFRKRKNVVDNGRAGVEEKMGEKNVQHGIRSRLEEAVQVYWHANMKALNKSNGVVRFAKSRNSHGEKEWTRKVYSFVEKVLNRAKGRQLPHEYHLVNKAEGFGPGKNVLDDMPMTSRRDDGDEEEEGNIHGQSLRMSNRSSRIPKGYLITSILEHLSATVADAGEAIKYFLTRKRLSHVEVRRLNNTMLVVRIQSPAGPSTIVSHVSFYNKHLYLRLETRSSKSAPASMSDHLIPLNYNIDSEHIKVSSQSKLKMHKIFLPLLNKNAKKAKLLKSNRNQQPQSSSFSSLLKTLFHRQTPTSPPELIEAPEDFSPSSTERITPNEPKKPSQESMQLNLGIVAAYLFGLVILVAGFADAVKQYKVQKLQKMKLDNCVSLPYQNTALYHRLDF